MFRQKTRKEEKTVQKRLSTKRNGNRVGISKNHIYNNMLGSSNNRTVPGVRSRDRAYDYHKFTWTSKKHVPRLEEPETKKSKEVDIYRPTPRHG